MRTANLIALAAGCVLCWTSPSLPKFKNANESSFVLTDFEAAWVGSLTPLGAAVGPIPAGILADALGRKPTLLGDSALLLLSWALISFASSAGWLYAARFIAGLATGCIFAVLPMYIGEIATVGIARYCAGLGRAQPGTNRLGARRTACGRRWAP